MKKMKLITLLLSAALIAASFAGCGSSASAEPGNSPTKQEQPPEQNQNEPIAKETMAKIVSMEGNTITVIPADKPEGRNDQLQDSEPSIDSGGQTSEDQPGRALEFTGDEVTYTLSDSVKVTRGEGKDASDIDLSDIDADSIIMFITSDENGSEVITSIRVLDKA